MEAQWWRIPPQIIKWNLWFKSSPETLPTLNTGPFKTYHAWFPTQLCSVFASNRWSSENPLKWPILHAVGQMRLPSHGTRQQHLRVLFKHMPSCYAALPIYSPDMKNTLAGDATRMKTSRKTFCRDKQMVTRGTCILLTYIDWVSFLLDNFWWRWQF